MAGETLYYAIYLSTDPDPTDADDITNTGSTWYTSYGVDNANEAAPLVDSNFTFADLAENLSDDEYKVAVVWTADGNWSSAIAIGTFIVGGTDYQSQMATDGAIAHWRFEESSGDAVDGLGGFNGTCAGIGYNYPEIGHPDINTKSFYFNRSNPSTVTVSAPVAGLDNHFDGGGTVEAIICPWDNDATNSAYRIVAKDGSFGTNNGWNGWAFLVDHENTRLQFFQRFTNGGSASYGLWNTTNIGDDSLQPGKAYHVAVTYDADSNSNIPKFYINGKLVTTYNIQMAPGGYTRESDSNCDFVIGNYDLSQGATSYPYNGLIDEVALFDSILTDDQIANHYGLFFGSTPYSRKALEVRPDVVLAHWPMTQTLIDVEYDNAIKHDLHYGENDAGFGDVVLRCDFDGSDGQTSATDYSNTPHTLTFHGNARLRTYAYQYGTSALFFDGSGDYVSVPDHADWDFGSGDFTMEMWVRINSRPSPWGAIISNFNNNGLEGWRLLTNPDGTLHFIISDSGPSTYSGYLPLGEFAHIAIVRHGNEITQYISGIATQTISYTGSIPNSTQSLKLGSTDGSNWFISGLIDDLRITKGVARYTRDFVPTERALPTVASSNAPTTKVTDQAGTPNGAISFATASEVMTVPGWYGPTGAYFGVGFWMKTNANAGDPDIIVWGDTSTGSNGEFLEIQVSALYNSIRVHVGGGNYRVANSGNITNDVWRHVICSIGTDLNSVNIYIDGSLISATTVGSNVAINITDTDAIDFKVGGGLLGELSDVTIWNGGIGQTDVTALYNA